MRIGGLGLSVALLMGVVCSVVFAQQDTLWTRRLQGTGNGWDEVRAMASDVQGNVYAVSQNKYDLPATGKCAVMLVKYSSAGVRLWQRRYVGPGYAVPAAITVGQFGSVYVVGSVGAPLATTDMLVMKYSTDGDSDWVRFHDASGSDDFATSLTLDDSGNVYVGGMCCPGSGGGEDCALVKYRGDGAFCWAQYFNSSGSRRDRTMAAAYSPAGCVYAAGRSAGTNLILMRYEPDGTQSWFRETLSDSWSRPVRLAVDRAGCALVSATETWPQQGLVTVKYTPTGDTVWTRHVHDNGQYPVIAGIKADSLDNVVIAGRTVNLYADGTVALVVKYAPDGTELWRAGTYSQFVYDSLEALAVNSRNEILVTGQRKGGFSSQNPYCLTRKYSPDGVELWTRFWIPPDSGATSARASTLIRDELCIGGFSQYECEFGGDTSAFLLRYDDTGGTAWRSRFVGPGVCAGDGLGVTFDSDGDVIVCGWLDMTGENEDAVVAKYSLAGDLLWQRNLGTEPGSEDRFTKVAIDAAGNVYATGHTDSVGTSDDYLTAKYDADGTLQWVQRYDGPANGDDKAAGLAIDRQGNVIVTGKSKGIGTGYDYATVKYSPSGQELWVRRHNGIADSADFAVGVVADTDGAVIVLGQTWVRRLLQPALVIKYGADGTQLWSVPCTTMTGPLGPVLDRTGCVCFGGNVAQYPGLAAVKVSREGDTLWATRESSNNNAVHPAGVAVDSTDRFVLASTLFTSTTGMDYLTVVYDPLGQVLWTRSYDDSAHDNDQLKAVSVDRNGTVFVSGGLRVPEGTVSLGYDSTGRQVWYSLYKVPQGPDYYTRNWPRANSVSPAGLLAVTGFIYHFDLVNTRWNGVADFLTILYAPQLALSEQPTTLPQLPELAINVRPNPAVLPLQFEVAQPGQGRLTLRIYDLAGRLTRTLLGHADSRGSGKYEWDGRDDQGRLVSSGVYLAVATLEGDGPVGCRPALCATRKVVIR